MKVEIQSGSGDNWCVWFSLTGCTLLNTDLHILYCISSVLKHIKLCSIEKIGLNKTDKDAFLAERLMLIYVKGFPLVIQLK